MCCLSEYLVADRVLELVHCVWVVGPRPIHFYKLAWLKGISSDRVSVILFDERHDIKDIEDKSIGCTDRILKRGKRQSATIEGQPLKWGFFLSPRFVVSILSVRDVHLVLGMTMLAHDYYK